MGGTARVSFRHAILRRSLWLTLLLVFAAPAFSGDAKPLRVGLDPRYPPWAFVPGVDKVPVDSRKDPVLSRAELAKVDGIDVDVSRAVARELGRPLLVVPIDYFRLEPALLAGEIDLIVNAWNRTRETLASIRESEAYYTWGLMIAARTDDARIRSAADLRGKRVGHYESQLVNQTLHSLGAAELKSYDSEARLFADLKAGVIDAIVYDSPAVRWRARQDRTVRAVGEPLNKLGYHIALRAGDEELLLHVQTAIQSLRRLGILPAIQRRWDAPAE